MMSLRAAWVSGVASTIPPSAAVFLAAYSWILFTKRDWMGSAWAAAAMAGVLVLRQRLAREAQTLVAREHMYGQFDTVIVAGGSRLPCHREVLMEHSAYFRSMFSKFKEKDVACVELKDIQDPRVMSQIIHYMYFHAVSLSPTTVQDILSIAHYLQIENLTETCVEFVRERIDKRNAVSVYLY